MIGATKITERQKEVLRQLVLYRCQGCTNHERKVGKLQPHRITRGHAGGKYCPSNIQMVCSNCHKVRHANEPGIRQK